MRWRMCLQGAAAVVVVGLGGLAALLYMLLLGWPSPPHTHTNPLQGNVLVGAMPSISTIVVDPQPRMCMGLDLGIVNE